MATAEHGAGSAVQEVRFGCAFKRISHSADDTEAVIDNGSLRKRPQTGWLPAKSPGQGQTWLSVQPRRMSKRQPVAAPASAWVAGAAFR
jgi:hypothetical protein